MLCSFLLYSKEIQIYISIHIFFICFSVMVYHRILHIVPCAIQAGLVVYSFYVL